MAFVELNQQLQELQLELIRLEACPKQERAHLEWLHCSLAYLTRRLKDQHLCLLQGQPVLTKQERELVQHNHEHQKLMKRVATIASLLDIRQLAKNELKPGSH